MGTLVPSPLVLKTFMAGRPLERIILKGREYLNFAFVNDILVGNTLLKKKQEYLVTYQSLVAANHIDCILVPFFIIYRRSFKKQVSNVKAILG